MIKLIHTDMIDPFFMFDQGKKKIMTKIRDKINKLQLAGLIVGIILAASIQLALVPPVISFYEFVLAVYFLAGLLFGYLSPNYSWKWGIWITLPWIAWIFFNIADAGFKDGIMGNAGWLVFYSFPLIPACAGGFAGAAAGRWRRK